jgi:hypothetical protein
VDIYQLRIRRAGIWFCVSRSVLCTDISCWCLKAGQEISRAACLQYRWVRQLMNSCPTCCRHEIAGRPDTERNVHVPDGHLECERVKRSARTQFCGEAQRNLTTETFMLCCMLQFRHLRPGEVHTQMSASRYTDNKMAAVWMPTSERPLKNAPTLLLDFPAYRAKDTSRHCMLMFLTLLAIGAT